MEQYLKIEIFMTDFDAKVINNKTDVEFYYSKDILNKKPLVHNEENTKQALINPFLLLLGYDIHDPNEVEFEFKASFFYCNKYYS